MAIETEAKYRVDCLESVEARLETLGAEFLGETEQKDTFFDRPDDSLRLSGCGLRLRRLKVLNTGLATVPKAQITFKGPVDDDGKAKKRLELQTGLDDPDAMAQLLEELGYIPKITISKCRRSYLLDRAHVELDDLPSLGTFVEIEADYPETIDAIRMQLGIESPHVPGSYVEMVASDLKGA